MQDRPLCLSLTQPASKCWANVGPIKHDSLAQCCISTLAQCVSANWANVVANGWHNIGPTYDKLAKYIGATLVQRIKCVGATLTQRIKIDCKINII